MVIKQSNLSRSMLYLKEQGWTIGKVEMPWNKFTKKRQDLFGILDAIGINGTQTVGIQACGSGDFKKHCEKLVEAKTSKLWVESGNLLLIIGWRQVKLKRGKARMVWKPRELWIDSLCFGEFLDKYKVHLDI